ncbi:MAG: Cof-type HAD-IIB family hydrolase [Clostridiales bacterium]|nr:Cof-type HAD-IIB family hydrolase [Clostridiales bacterium]
MPVRAIAFDLDDTLLRSDLTVSDHTVEVLHNAASRGIMIFPASGRTRDSMYPTVARIGCASAFISCNGADVWTKDRQLLMQELLPVDLAHEVARFAQERGVYCQTYSPDRFFYSIDNDYAVSYAQSSSLEGEFVGDLTAFIRKPVTKLLMMDEPERIAALLEEARALFAGRASLTCSKPYFLECNPLRATKGNALRWCAAHFGFGMHELVAFGDSLNDVSMLEAAGTGVVMANARADVKAMGFAVCGSNEEDGVARYIEEMILQ